MTSENTPQTVKTSTELPIPYNVTHHAPLLTGLARRILGNANPSLQDIKSLALLTPRSPDRNNPQLVELLPTIESLREQLREENIPQYFDDFRKHGFFFSLDGKDIQKIDHDPDLGPHMADAVIAGNLEIILQTAQLLGIKQLTSLYSGDEDIGMVSCHGGTNEENRKLFEATAQAISEAYYQDPFFTPLLDKFPKPGFRLATISPNNAYVYAPLHKDGAKHTIHLATLIGTIIDVTNPDATIPSEGTRLPLVDELERVLSATRTSHQTERVDEQSLYTTLEQFEPKFPRNLQIKKIANLEKDILESRQQRPEEIYFIRLADIRIKEINKKSHTLGDFHMIATANILQQYLATNDINPHDGIEYYQHNGSFLLKLNKQAYDSVCRALSDPLAINEFSYLKEQARSIVPGQDPAYRAHPFIVSTCSISREDKLITPTLLPDQDSKEVWNIVDQLKKDQFRNEILVAVYASGLASQLLDATILTIENILAQRGFNPHRINNLNFLLSLISLYNNYQQNRPASLNNLQLLKIPDLPTH